MPSNLLCSLGPVREICQNLPHVERRAQNSIRKCGGQVYRKVIYNACIYMYECIVCISKRIHHAASVECACCCRSFSVLVNGLDGKNHQMTVLSLLHPIDEKDSYKKVNTTFTLQR